ncbi:MAG: AgmX/PglI C-terminal domain-containing protein [Myxococcales bacterium]|nr:AgmX/PglI C-terminal domain-containing protein [Myxococcales bacterium]
MRRRSALVGALFLGSAGLTACAGSAGPATPSTAGESEAPSVSEGAMGGAGGQGEASGSTAEGGEEPAALVSDAAKGPRAFEQADPLTTAAIQKVVRARFDEVGACYGLGLAREPKLAGTIEVRLSIAGDGHVVAADADPAKGGVSTDPDRPMSDPEVVRCVEKMFEGLSFAPTKRGLVQVIYPVVLRTE